jgi:hypothetical protein
MLGALFHKSYGVRDNETNAEQMLSVHVVTFGGYGKGGV